MDRDELAALFAADEERRRQQQQQQSQTAEIEALFATSNTLPLSRSQSGTPPPQGMSMEQNNMFQQRAMPAVGGFGVAPQAHQQGYPQQLMPLHSQQQQSHQQHRPQQGIPGRAQSPFAHAQMMPAMSQTGSVGSISSVGSADTIGSLAGAVNLGGSPSLPQGSGVGIQEQRMHALNNLMARVSPHYKESFISLYHSMMHKKITQAQFLEAAKQMIPQSPPVGQPQIHTAANQQYATSPTPTFQSNLNYRPPGRPRKGTEKKTVAQTKAQGRQTGKMQGPPNQQIGQGSGDIGIMSQSTQLSQFNTAPQATASSANDSGKVMDVHSMMDVTSYGGVDLREEEDAIMSGMLASSNNEEAPFNLTASEKHYSRGLPPEQRQLYLKQLRRDKVQRYLQQRHGSLAGQSFLNKAALYRRVGKIAEKYGLDQIDSSALDTISEAAREKITDLMELVIVIAKHRVGLHHRNFIESEMQQLQNDPTDSLAKTLEALGEGVGDEVTTVVPMKRKPGLADDDDYDEDNDDNKDIKKEEASNQDTKPSMNDKSSTSTADTVKALEQRKYKVHAVVPDPENTITKVLAKIEDEERETERALKLQRINRIRRDKSQQSVKDGDDDGDDSASGKKAETKGQGPRSSDLPEFIKMQRTNQALAVAIGGKPLKTWMTAGADSSASSGAKSKSTELGHGFGVGETAKKGKKGKSKKAAASPSSATTDAMPSHVGVVVGSRVPGNVAAGPQQKKSIERRKIIVKDVLFYLESEHAFAKSKVLYKWLALNK